jgi:hypothetical protein
MHFLPIGSEDIHSIDGFGYLGLDFGLEFLPQFGTASVEGW